MHEHRRVPDLIICSDSVRARLTAEAAAAHARYDGEIFLEPNLCLGRQAS